MKAIAGQIAVLLITILSYTTLTAQIRLPKEYVCSKNSDWSRTIFVGTNNLVMMEAMARSMADVPAIIEYYKTLGYPFPFQKASDGLWWGTGNYKGQAYYIVIEPKTLFAFTAISTDPVGSDFSKFCSWLGNAIRSEKKGLAEKLFVLRIIKVQDVHPVNSNALTKHCRIVSNRYALHSVYSVRDHEFPILQAL